MQTVNAGPQQLTIDCRFAEVPVEGVTNFLIEPDQTPVQPSSRGSTNSAGPTMQGILTSDQYKQLSRTLEQQAGVNILSLVRVTTLGDRQAQIKAVDIKYIVTDLDVQPGNVVNPISEPFEIGPSIDVVPHVRADGYTIDMTIIPSIREFLGYDLEAAKQLSAAVPNLAATPPLPMFRYRSAASRMTLWDGQTVVLGLGAVELQDKNNAQKKPLVAHRFVFVTPRLIDPAGNALHSEEEMAFSRTNVPPQHP
jgi:type II secretory pathway component GspD/PulD (secretin)